MSMKSAGIAYSIIQACSRGLLRGCSCDQTKTDGSWSDEGWKWGGCSADTGYGLQFAKIFVDAADEDKSARSLMNLHNSRAGRKVVYLD